MLKFKWDDSQLHTSYVDVCKVSCTHDEVVLQFGISQARQTGQEDQTIRLVASVILTPFSAKRLAQVLSQRLSPSGSLPEPPAPKSIRSQGDEPLASRRLPFFHPSEPAAEKAGLLFRLVQGLQVDYGVESSVKFSRKTLRPNRFLLTLSKNSLELDPDERILRICGQLEMPEIFLIAFQAQLLAANYVHFGFEEKKHTCLYKAYLEFWTNWEEEIFKRPERTEPFLLYQGFKWDPADNTQPVLTKYTCWPSLTPEAILARLSGIYHGANFRKPLDVTRSILNIAASKVAYHNILYLDVVEENNPRNSFDINIYRAKIRVKEVHHLLLKMSRHYSIPLEQFQEIYEKIEGMMVGHISGGIDREGKDFFTLYYRG